MPAALLRIRTREGIQRIEVEPAEPLYNVKKKLSALINVSANDIVLARDPAGLETFRDDTKSVDHYKMKHGDMIHVTSTVGGRLERPASGSAAGPSSAAPAAGQGSTSAAAQPVAAAPEAPGSVKRCIHGPGAKCVHCLPATGPDAAEGKKKCLHGAGAICPNCMNSTATGKKIEWLCKHGPGAKCPNCIKITKKWAAKKPPCTHPANMVCPNCVDDEKDEPKAGDKPIGAPADKVPKRACTHGPKGMCENCLPKEQEEGKPVLRRCRNHGPHGSCIECMTVEEARKPRIKSQDYANVAGVSIDYSAANHFQAYLQEIRFAERRVGICFGSYSEADSTVKVDAIYEPPQAGTKDKIHFKDDPEFSKVEALAALLGMRPVGWIFTHPHRNYSMASDEVIKGAELSAKFGKHFVTLVCFETKEKAYSFEAFQLSDQCIDLYKHNYLVASHDDPKVVLTREPVIVERADAMQVDTSFFLVTLPIRDHRSHLSTEFPIENRRHPLAKSDLKIHLINNSRKPYVERISDFHLLLFLSRHLSLETDMPALCKAVCSRNMANLEGFQLIIDHLAGIAS
eukprot:tig00020614_g12230.t1